MLQLLHGILPQLCSTNLPTLAAPHMQLINLRSVAHIATAIPNVTSDLQWLTSATCQQHAQHGHDPPTISPPQGPSLNAAEVGKFAQLADTWWDPVGPFADLQRMNPARCRFIRDALCRTFGYVTWCDMVSTHCHSCMIPLAGCNTSTAHIGDTRGCCHSVHTCQLQMLKPPLR